MSQIQPINPNEPALIQLKGIQEETLTVTQKPGNTVEYHSPRRGKFTYVADADIQQSLQLTQEPESNQRNTIQNIFGHGNTFNGGNFSFGNQHAGDVIQQTVTNYGDGRSTTYTQTITNSQLPQESKLVIPPAGITLEFLGCNISNLILPDNTIIRNFELSGYTDTTLTARARLQIANISMSGFAKLMMYLNQASIQSAMLSAHAKLEIVSGDLTRHPQAPAHFPQVTRFFLSDHSSLWTKGTRFHSSEPKSSVFVRTNDQSFSSFRLANQDENIVHKVGTGRTMVS